MFVGRRFVLIGGIAAVVWYACLVIFWVLQPLSDSVPVGVDYTLAPPKFVSAAVDCSTMFASGARDDSPLPALKPQPKGSPQLAFQREPCQIVQHQARMLFALNTVVAGAAFAASGWFVARQLKSSRARARYD